ncbi:MAG: hypothetical protein ACRDGL_11375 [Candidatus Limnocylindrales bacterium]
MIGILAIAIILARHDREAGASSAGARTAASSEGETICPSCGMGNLVGDTNCAACGASLPSHQAPAEG